jgi:hypothetical protein
VAPVGRVRLNKVGSTSFLFDLMDVAYVSEPVGCGMCEHVSRTSLALVPKFHWFGRRFMPCGHLWRGASWWLHTLHAACTLSVGSMFRLEG